MHCKAKTSLLAFVLAAVQHDIRSEANTPQLTIAPWRRMLLTTWANALEGVVMRQLSPGVKGHRNLQLSDLNGQYMKITDDNCQACQGG